MTRLTRRLAALSAAVAAGVQELVARRYYARTAGPRARIEAGERTAWTPIWHETLAPLEWLALRASPVFRGDGLPGGDGAAVLLVPGFLTWGAYLRTLRDWLARIGYRARIADIGWNAECFDVQTERLLAQLPSDATAIHLVGHSLGGLLARAAAVRAPERVASVATLASPLRGLRIHPGLRLAAAGVRRWLHTRPTPRVRPECLTLACECAAVRAVHQPLPATLPQLCVLTRYDGLTDWRYSVDPSTPRCVEVTASHVGIVFNAKTYRALAEHLRAATAAAAPARWRVSP